MKETTGRYNAAWVNNLEALPPIVLEVFLEAARNTTHWQVSGKKNYLLSFYKDDNDELVVDKKTIVSARLKAKPLTDPEGYMTLIDMLLDCWEMNGVLEDALPGIMENFKS
jgi:hypothetical protein